MMHMWRRRWIGPYGEYALAYIREAEGRLWLLLYTRPWRTTLSLWYHCETHSLLSLAGKVFQDRLAHGWKIIERARDGYPAYGYSGGEAAVLFKEPHLQFGLDPSNAVGVSQELGYRFMGGRGGDARRVLPVGARVIEQIDRPERTGVLVKCVPDGDMPFVRPRKHARKLPGCT